MTDPDCRSEFIGSMSLSIRLALGDPTFSVVAPLLGLGKSRIVAEAVRLGVPIDRTWSCYNPIESDVSRMFYKLDIRACGRCDSCQLRIKGFKDAGFVDPIPYAIPIDWEGCVNV